MQRTASLLWRVATTSSSQLSCAAAAASTSPAWLYSGVLTRGPSRAESTAAASNAVNAATNDEAKAAYARKLLYRSRQRGFLELDLMVGLWAEREVPRMDTKLLDSLSQLLDEENPDLFKWLTGQLPPPQHLQQNAAFQSLHRWALGQVASRSPAASRSEPGKEWVRGWDDGWKKPAPEPVAKDDLNKQS